MKIRKLFQKTQFGIFGLFGLIVLSTSALTIYTVQTHLSAEYEGNSRNIAKTIADASVDILLNRNLATLQSLIDQFVEIQGIRYVYITSDNGEFLAHTFVPGIPKVISNSDPFETAAVKRTLPGMGEFVEVGSPILAGFAGTVHVGMDLNVIGLKIQRAIGQQVYLISILLLVGILASIWFVNLAAKPLGELLAFAVKLAKEENPDGAQDQRILARDDEAGELARLLLHVAQRKAGSEEPPPAASESAG
jgi:sensor histidine kinase regulating citrate/malate metabolism